MSKTSHKLAIILILTGVMSLSLLGQSLASNLSLRSIVLSNSHSSSSATHAFGFTITSPNPIGSIVFEYCSNSPLFVVPCTPEGTMSLAAAVLSQQSGNTGFVIDNLDSTSSKMVISRVAVAANTVASSYTFTNVINPAGTNQTTYVRLSTYTSTQGTGLAIDQGAVVFSTVPNFQVGAYVPPFLAICVGITVANDCSQANGSYLDLGTLSTSSTVAGTSQFAAATNVATGMGIYALGTTITSGNNIIQVLATPTASQKGIGQFGINLRLNASPIVGLDPSGLGTVVPTINYDTPNLFYYSSGDQIASVASSTDYTRATVSYIINIDKNQPVGYYSTTITYMATGSF